MKRNILTLLLALLISFTLVFVVPRLSVYQEIAKGGGMAGGLMIPFVTLIVVPLVFTVVGSRSSRRQGWYSFGISFFAAVLALMILGSSRIDDVRDAIRIECEEALERNRLYRLDHPEYTLVAPPCD